MLKFIQYVCLLFLVCSCSTRNEESVILQNETDMEKKNLGSVLALYPKPMTVVGGSQWKSKLACSGTYWNYWA